MLRKEKVYPLLREEREKVSVVATTHHSRTNDLTTSKALSRAIK